MTSVPSSMPGPVAAALLTHFDANRRAMPWRETSDPYAIWVSEVMLQQTRVDTVIPYWKRWIDRFPTVTELAEAELDEVLKHWEGLGYYSRARNLHSAARMVRERYGGALPDHPDELRRLPGVGEYTAGAVASIAFGVATPAVDGNVRRVVSRLYDLEAPTAGELRERAVALVPEGRPGDFNQALMELGATICTSRGPACERCPIAEWCEARRLGVQEERPLPIKRKPIPEETVRTLVLVRDDGRLLLVRRPVDGLLGGLWEFPEASTASEAALAAESADVLALDRVSHTFSHKRVHYEPVLGRAPDSAMPVSDMPDRAAGTSGAGSQREWVAPGRLKDYAMPVAQQKIARLALKALEV